MTNLSLAERLRTVLSYDPNTGIFTNRTDRPLAKAGCPAGSPDKYGYLQIFFEGKNCKAHRLAWLYMAGDWPAGNIDHVNGSRSDNRWSNLRVGSQALNAQNLRGPRRDNMIGLLGVSLDKRRGTYRAQIMVDGKSRHLGTFGDPQSAHQAYLKAKRTLHPGCTI
ncbi:HNH endonuclease signature motif containing protein [Achromobacter veterisilvae]|uniref:HNH endonuclease signature motif containing protein n=1 Tax=Achromobacter veterisilvae TaxID=2069367 RepID=UPI00100FEA29|nr:HNH endonuclease signature motif containing protein [Achromobacter veterisilvae]